jgi:malate synthase
MHGPDEVAFAVETFDRVEDVPRLPRKTVELGVRDREGRTSANPKACIRAAKARVASIDTGFLDRTGDGIETAMEAGPFSRKGFITRKCRFRADEDRDADIGLDCGLSGRAQIGTGMRAARAARSAGIRPN